MNTIFIQFYKHKEFVEPVLNGVIETIDKKNNNIVAIDNLSENSTHIRNTLRNAHSQGIIDRCYFMEGNYIFNSAREIVKHYLSENDTDYVTIADGDVIPPKLNSCWSKIFQTYFDKFSDLSAMGFSTDLHHQTKEELKKNAYDFNRVTRLEAQNCAIGYVPRLNETTKRIEYENYINKIDENVIECNPMYQYYMFRTSVIRNFISSNPKLTLGDGHLTKFVLGAKGRIFRYEKDYAKNLTYNDTLLQENNYTTYKNDRKQIVNTFHQYIDDVRWEEIK